MKLDTACSEGMQGRSAEQAPPLQAGARPQAFRNIATPVIRPISDPTDDDDDDDDADDDDDDNDNDNDNDDDDGDDNEAPGGHSTGLDTITAGHRHRIRKLLITWNMNDNVW